MLSVLDATLAGGTSVIGTQSLSQLVNPTLGHATADLATQTQNYKRMSKLATAHRGIELRQAGGFTTPKGP